MAKVLLVVATIVIAATQLHAEDAALVAARAAHTKEIARLKDKLVADIDAVIKSENEKGGGIDYLLRDKKGFVENGVLPLLPKLQPAARSYLTGKRKADESLAMALEKVGKTDEAKSLRADPMPTTEISEKVESKDVNTAGDLSRFLQNTVWVWADDGDLLFRPDGSIGHVGWEKGGIVTKWQAIDRRTVMLVVTKSRDTNTLAVLTFSGDLTAYKWIGFGTRELSETKTRKR